MMITMKVLLTGNIAYLTIKWIRQTFSDCRVFLIGETNLHSDPENGITVVRSQKNDQAIFEAYGFDVVILFSNALTFRSEEKGEMERLHAVLDACRKHHPVKLLYLTGPSLDNAAQHEIDDAAIQMCLRMAGDAVQLQVVRSLYLYSGAIRSGWFYRMFENLDRRSHFHFEDAAVQHLCFLAMDDLSELIRRMLEDWPEANGALDVPECFGHTFQDLSKRLAKLNAGWSFSFDENAPVSLPAPDDRKLRRQYGWFPKYSVLDDLPDLYEEYRRARPLKRTLTETLRQLIARHRKWLLLAELLVAVALTVLCGHLSQWQVQFGLIDFRLLLIVLMGTMHGMNMGILAATAASVLLVFSYQQQGVGWITLFYEPSNWIVFIAYYTIGAVCGYVRLLHTDKIRFTSEENELLKEKLSFAQSLYNEVLADKREYKKQIISSKDSFGKIFQITQQLNLSNEKEIFIQTVEILESIMENQSVALYMISSTQQFGRLVASSRQAAAGLPASIRLDDYGDALKTVKEGGVFVNTQLLEGYPALMAGLVKDGEIRMLVMLRQAKFEQMSLYYMNLFHVLCGLVSSALNHAVDYQQAQQQKNYLPGTRILNAERFEQEQKLHDLMDDRKIAKHILLKIEDEGRSVQEMDYLLSGKLRENDVIGIGNDGCLYVILAQASQESLPIILRRLQQAGVSGKEVHAQKTA